MAPSATSGAKWKTLVARQVATFPLLLATVIGLDALFRSSPPIVRSPGVGAITRGIAAFIARVARVWRLKETSR